MTAAHDANSTDNLRNIDSHANALPFARLVHWMSLTEQTLAALFLFVIVSTMGAQVFARYFFGSPFSWSEEVSRMALIWMSFMAAAFVMAQQRHITVDVLSHRLSVRGQLWLECLSHIIVAGTCLMLLIGGRHFVWYMGKVGTPSLEIPKSLWYGAVSVGMLLMSIHSVVNLLQVLAAGRPTALDGMEEEEGFHLELEQGE